jgi:hypothetical protein
MTFRQLKAELVMSLAIGYADIYGNAVQLHNAPQGMTTLSASLGELSITVTNWQGTTRVEIWDSLQGKVFFGIKEPLEVARCDPGPWFNVFLNALLVQRDAAINFLAEFHGGQLPKTRGAKLWPQLIQSLDQC